MKSRILKKSYERKTILLAISLISSLFSGIAHAHGVQGDGLINGIMHPVFGVDHLLAMVAVGVLSVQLGGRAIWAVPMAFVAFMLCGGCLGMLGMPFFAVETGIASSVLLLGIAIAFDRKMTTVLPMLFVGVFALFHGYAHGIEMPDLAKPALYAIGFIVATTFLHIAGIFIGKTAEHFRHGRALLRYTGAGVAGIGFAILFGL